MKPEPDVQHVEIYRFGGFALDLGTLELMSGGQPLQLRPRSVTALAYLIENRDRTVSRAELMRVLWPDVRVASGSLTQTIWEIRKALGEPRSGRLIQTSRGRGYRFTALVQGHDERSIHIRAVPGT